MDFKNYINELKRRKVFKAALAYIAFAWLIAQVTADVLPIFEIPAFLQQTIIIVLILGFPIILIFAWIYDVTPQGIKKTAENDNAEISSKTRQHRLNRIFISILLLGILLILYNQFGQSFSKTTEVLTSEAIQDGIDNGIAVLPLQNWSGDPDLEYISDGVTDAIIIRLSTIKSIQKVIPFTSVLVYKNTDKSIAEIAKELGVNTILQGSFQLSGEEVNVKVQMLDGTSEKTFWNNEYRSYWKSDEIFELQSTVAENVASEINAKITESESKSIRRIPTSNKDAYRYFLQAEYQLSRLSYDGFVKSRHLYEEAISLDSTFIEPYIGMANTYLLSGFVWGFVPQNEAWSISKSIYQKALRIDKNNDKEYQRIIPYFLAVGYAYFEYDFQPIERIYEEISDVSDPIMANNAIGFSFDYSRKVGRLDDALRINNFLIELYPVTGHNFVHKASTLFLLGRQDEALQIFQEFDTIYNNEYFYLMESSKYYYYLGEENKSKKNLELFKTSFPHRPPIIIWLETIHANEENETEIIQKNLALLHDLYLQKAPGSPAWFIALYYCERMDYEKAFEWLQKSYDQNEVEMTWLRSEPLLAPVRNDKRYIDLYNKMGFPVPPLSIPEDNERVIL